VTRSFLALAALIVVALGAVVYGRSRDAQEAPNRVTGVAIKSRIPCDGSTNPQQELDMTATFSRGGSPRSFHLDLFESKYCKYADLYFICLKHGHDGWRHIWSASNQQAGSARVWINACADWGSKETPEYILSGWYQDSPPKCPWKQAVIRRPAPSSEVYDLTDSAGGTARLEIKRK
jgi:hypothetical protein